MDTLTDFLKKPMVKKQINKPISEALSVDMNRDPFRPLYIDKHYFLSPADGFVLYHREVNPDQDIIEVKGGKYTVNTLLREGIKERCLVIGIYMCYIDVHINRIPTHGFVAYEKMPCLKVANLSMRPIEAAILDKMGKVDHNEMRYAFYNETMKNKIYTRYLNQHYYILQIADFEVDVIVPFQATNSYFTQGERFSLVRLGSQVDVIVPYINKDLFFKDLIPDDGEIYHVTAGVDQLIKVEGWQKRHVR